MEHTEPDWHMVKQNGAKLGDGERDADATNARKNGAPIATTDQRYHDDRCIVEERDGGE